MRPDLAINMVLTGGSTMFPGLEDRLRSEIGALIPPHSDLRARIIAPPERHHTVWFGGFILSSLSTFDDEWVTRKRYDEYGATLVHKMCF